MHVINSTRFRILISLLIVVLVWQVIRHWSQEGASEVSERWMQISLKIVWTGNARKNFLINCSLFNIDFCQSHQRSITVRSGCCYGFLWSTLSGFQTFCYQTTASRILQSTCLNRLSIDSIWKGNGESFDLNIYTEAFNDKKIRKLFHCLDNNECGWFACLSVSTRRNRMQCQHLPCLYDWSDRWAEGFNRRRCVYD